MAQDAAAKKVICVDGCNSAFVNNHEGYERANMAAGDVIQVGGNLQDCLNMLANGDTLVIVAHGWGMGQGFIWNGMKYTGFGGGAGQGATPHPVPAGFNMLMNITVRFCSCWSAKDPDNMAGGDRPLTEKIVDAMGGAGAGNTAGGYTDLATARVCYEVTGPNPQQAINNLKNGTGWMGNPPTNRPGAAMTQQTAGQAQLDMRFPPAGTYKFKITAYKQPTNEVAAPAPNGSAGCVCTDNAPYCAFGTSDAHDYIVTGTGGPIPLTGSGGGGTWPNVLPPNALMRQIVLPTDATSIDWVSFKALSHTYVGDLQFVLYGPSGVGHNLAHRPGFTGTGFGLSTDLAGDYTIIGADAPAPWPTTVPLVLPPQSYNQYFGNWPSGVNNIFNTPMNAIPVVPGGIYTLAVFDWAGGDMGNLATWNVAGHGPPGPAVYCSAGTTTNMCFASISASHQPSVSFANACMIATVNVEGQKNGITFYGLASNITPWGPGSTSFLCVKPPTQRTGGQTSGGTNGLCDGMFVLDWNAYQIANPTALGNPWNVGSKAYLQSWFRDPPAVKTTNLSNAVEITYLP